MFEQINALEYYRWLVNATRVRSQEFLIHLYSILDISKLNAFLSNHFNLAFEFPNSSKGYFPINLVLILIAAFLFRGIVSAYRWKSVWGKDRRRSSWPRMWGSRRRTARWGRCEHLVIWCSYYHFIRVVHSVPYRGGLLPVRRSPSQFLSNPHIELCLLSHDLTPIWCIVVWC